MRTMKNLLLCLVFLLFVHALPGVDSITLYFEPDTEAAVATEIDTGNSALERAEPVLEAAKQEQGWLWMEYVVTFNGFVKNEEIGKNLAVNTGAFVRLRPDGASPVLTIIEKDDVADIIHVGDWAEIELTKAVPVYLQKSASASPVAEVAQTLILDVEPAVSRPVVTTGGPVKTVVHSGSIQSPNFEGTLKPYRRLFRLPSKYSLKLVDERGKRIALVDDERLLISGSLNDYLGRRVVIFGVMEPIKEPKSYVIKATAMRLKQFAVPD